MEKENLSASRLASSLLRRFPHHSGLGFFEPETHATISRTIHRPWNRPAIRRHAVGAARRDRGVDHKDRRGRTCLRVAGPAGALDGRPRIRHLQQRRRRRRHRGLALRPRVRLGGIAVHSGLCRKSGDGTRRRLHASRRVDRALRRRPRGSAHRCVRTVGDRRTRSQPGGCAPHRRDSASGLCAHRLPRRRRPCTAMDGPCPRASLSREAASGARHRGGPGCRCTLDAPGAAAAFAAASWAAVAIQWPILRTRLKPLLLGARKFEFGRWLAACLPLTLFEGSILLMSNVDVVLMSVWREPQETGAYFAAVRAASLLGFVPFAVAAAATRQIFDSPNGGSPGCQPAVCSGRRGGGVSRRRLRERQRWWRWAIPCCPYSDRDSPRLTCLLRSLPADGSFERRPAPRKGSSSPPGGRRRRPASSPAPSSSTSGSGSCSFRSTG